MTDEENNKVEMIVKIRFILNPICLCKIRSFADKWQVRQRLGETLGHDKASLGGCRGTLDLCMGTLFEVPAAVGEEPFDVGFLQAWLLLEDFREVLISLNEICCKFGCLFRVVEDGLVY